MQATCFFSWTNLLSGGRSTGSGAKNPAIVLRCKLKESQSQMKREVSNTWCIWLNTGTVVEMQRKNINLNCSIRRAICFLS